MGSVRAKEVYEGNTDDTDGTAAAEFSITVMNSDGSSSYI